MSDSFDHLFIAPSGFDASLAFYQGTLGWEIKHQWGEGPGTRGAVLASSKSMSVTIAEPHDDEDDNAWRLGVRGRQPTIHLNTDDVDGRFEQVGGGDHMVIEPEDTHWGSRWFVVKDPDDNLIAFNGRPAGN